MRATAAAAVACAVALLVSGPLTAQSPTDARIDSVFAAYGPTTPGCAVGVYRDGAIAFARGYGMADLGRGQPITPASIFDIGSTSKQLTAASILLLAQDGRLSLDDDVRRHVPELPDYGTPITIGHLLHHTSGLRDYIGLLMLGGAEDTGRTTPQDALDAIVRQRALNFEPGSDYLYSNTGYFLLSQIVERVSGQSMAAFAKARIFEPLGMRNSYYRDGTAPEPAALATAYAPTPGGFETYMSLWEQTGDGAVHTSLEDLLRWDENFYRHSVGGRALIDELERVDTLTGGRAIDYARGLIIDEYRGLRRVSHGGAWAGYRAELMRIPSRHLSAAVLCNVANSDPSGLAERVLDIFLEDVAVTAAAAPATAAEPVRIELPASELSRWAGTYRNPGTGTLRPVSVQEGRLTATFGSMSAELVPTGPAQFVASVGARPLVLRFEDGAAPGARRMRQFVDGNEVAVFEEVDPTPAGADELTAVAGRYASEEIRGTFEIRADGAALRFILPAGDMPMTRLRADTWAAGPFTLNFTRDAGGLSTGFTLDQGRARGIAFTRIRQ